MLSEYPNLSFANVAHFADVLGIAPNFAMV
jgi:hypothetical protein